MLVYGERSREVDTKELVARLVRKAVALAKTRPGLHQHLDLVRLLVDAGELMQGVADTEDEAEGYAAQGQSWPRQLWAGAVMGANLYRSCINVDLLPPPRIMRKAISNLSRLEGRILRLQAASLPPRITVKTLEGFAYYSVYPEMYVQAAVRFSEDYPKKRSQAVGILSIGAALAEVLEGTLAERGSLGDWYCVRPRGHPFSRQLKIPEFKFKRREQRNEDDVMRMQVREAILWQRPHLVVDEGPGLSASSFGAVADWLESQGLAREHIVFFPSHDNPLVPQASEAHRERWATARKYVASFESVFIESGKLAEWVADLTGGVGALEDIGYGRWRAKLLSNEQDWPPVNVQQERRKYLCHAGGKHWLLKFAGLGHYGEDKLPLARSLAAAGFIAPLVGLRHGFIVSEWLAEAQPLTNALLQQIDREWLLDFIAAYLAHRAHHFPAPASSGATVLKLFEMLRYNTAQRIGEQYAARLDRWQAQLAELAADERRVLTDNKMQPWEWLLLPDGRLLKADALDHHAAHDLVGAQDVAWDLVGAIIELNLSRDQAQRLFAAFEAKAGYRPTRQQLAFYTYAYIAFQVGHYTLSAQALADTPAEAARLREAASAWAALLGERIESPPNYE
jgi:hypothetical protein